MRDWQSQSHVKWYCKYPVVFVPKYRRRAIYGNLRKQIGRTLRELCQDGWRAPCIDGELLKLGLDVSETTVSRYMPRRPVDPDKAKRWIAFLENHKDAIAAMDFFIATNGARPRDVADEYRRSTGRALGFFA